jgi:hypothetical protein
MRVAALLCGLTMLVGSNAHAAYDKAKAKKTIQELIKFEGERMKELEGVAKNDQKMADDIEKGVKAREKGAATWDAKQKEFTEMAGLSDGSDKTEFENFAKEMDVFKQHDKDLADGRQKAATILHDQAKGAHDGAEAHKAHMEKLKAKLATIK